MTRESPRGYGVAMTNDTTTDETYQMVGTLRPGDTSVFVESLVLSVGTNDFYTGATERKLTGPFSGSDLVDMVPVRGRVNVWCEVDRAFYVRVMVDGAPVAQGPGRVAKYVGLVDEYRKINPTAEITITETVR